VTGNAVGCAGKATVIGLRSTEPGACGLVTILTNALPIVNSRRWPPSGTETGAHMTCCALSGHRDISVKDTRVPTGVTALVTAVAIGNRHTAKGLVRYVVGCGTACGWKPTGVTRRTLVCNRHLVVVPCRGFPTRGGMAADAIQ
jgi:hypothetical protein